MKQYTICDDCGKSDLEHDRAVWMDDGASYCPSCRPQPTSNFDRLDAHARSIWPQRDADWLDQLDWTDAAFAYGLMAVVAVGCFTLGLMAGAYFF